MKKFIYFFAGIALLFALNCKSIERSSVNGKEVVVANQMNPVIFTVWGAPVSKCLADLEAEGVKEVTQAESGVGAGVWIGKGGLFSSSRLSSTEYCRATGTK